MNTISIRELRNHTADVVRRVEGGEVLYVTVYGHPKMELRSVTPSSWLDELMSTEPIDTGWLDEIEARREGEMALDWPTE